MTSPFTAGQKIHASDLNIFIAGAAANGNLSCTTTSLADVPGATITFTTTHANVVCTVTGIFDITAVAVGSTATGHLSVDGSDQSAQAIYQSAANNGRSTVSQCWTITLASSGSHTLKLRAALAAAAGTYQVNTPHTTINALVCDL
jgi:hypothetical protein